MNRPPPGLVLVTGPEPLLVERAVSGALAQVREGASDLEVVRLGGAGYEPGSLGLHANPSLFGDAKALVVESLDEAGDELLADLGALLPVRPDELALVVVHRGGPRGRKVLDTLRQGGAVVIDCPAVRTDRDKTDFVVEEFRRNGRRVTAAAVRALVEAVGRDLRELAAACRQLVDDTDGVVDEDVVDLYHGGKVEATGFRVADAAMAGHTGEALRLLRHAVATGVDPVPLVAVLASSVRTLVRVGAAGRASRATVAKALGLPPWQVDKARRVLGHWDGQALGAAIEVVAEADAEVKGGGRDPVYAVERAVLAVVAARAGRGAGAPP